VTRLTVLFDGQCRACARFRRWLGGEPAYDRLSVVPFRSAEAARRFPALVPAEEGHADLVVVGERGEVWRGANAWRMCLWALRRHRRRSLSSAQAESARHEHDAALAAARASWPGLPPPQPTTPAWTFSAEPATETGSGCRWLALLVITGVGLALALSPDVRAALAVVAVLTLLVAAFVLVQSWLVGAAVPRPPRDAGRAGGS
jgi:predicted DCC family thiol-disulfide oxidoreductase YuxK